MKFVVILLVLCVSGALCLPIPPLQDRIHTMANTTWCKITETPLPAALKGFTKGIADNDCDNFYMTDGKQLAATDAKLVVQSIHNVITNSPMEKQGYHTIGDLGYFATLVYAPIYGNAGIPAFIAKFDSSAQTMLGYIATSQTTAPWVTVDYINLQAISSEVNATELLTYDVDSMKPNPSIKLSQPLHNIESGTFVSAGLIYLVADKAVYSVELATGNVSLVRSLHDEGGDRIANVWDLSSLHRGILHILEKDKMVDYNKC